MTGFRVKGQLGIVTALHGVADCQVINAQPVIGNPLNSLIIAQVDIDRDVARLWSKELETLPTDGLEAITKTQSSDYQQVCAVHAGANMFLRQMERISRVLTAAGVRINV